MQGGKLFLQNMNRNLLFPSKNNNIDDVMDVDIMKSMQKLENYENMIIYYILLR